MDRKEFVNIYNNIVNPNPNAANTHWGILIEEYCKEKGKTDANIIEGIKQVMFTPAVNTDYCIEKILEHFRNKFEIVRVIDKDSRIIKIF